MSKEPTKEDLQKLLSRKLEEAELLKRSIEKLRVAEAKATVREIKGKPTIDELKALLERDEDDELHILPNGEIRAVSENNKRISGGRKPITLREDLGGEYGQVA